MTTTLPATCPQGDIVVDPRDGVAYCYDCGKPALATTAQRAQRAARRGDGPESGEFALHRATLAQAQATEPCQASWWLDLEACPACGALVPEGMPH